MYANSQRLVLLGTYIIIRENRQRWINLLKVTLHVESRFKDNVTPFSEPLSRTVAPDKMALAVCADIFDGHFCYPVERV